MPLRNRSMEAHRGPFKRKRYSTAAQHVLFSETADLMQHYDLGKELGRGQFGVIRRCTNKHTGEIYACKSISKTKLISQQELEDVRREIEIMRHVGGHPNIVGLKDVYEDKAFVHIVMELCKGGDLFDRIIERHCYPEKEAAELIRSLVEVIKYCHDMGVVHRDLKPENILFAYTFPFSPIKLADFGLALHFTPGEKFSGVAGSAYYLAPEILNGHYSHEVDLWSIGVILYVLLSGVPPFWGETERSIFEAIKEGEIDFASDPWPQISPSAKHLIRRLLCPDPKARFTSEQVLQHPWILYHTLGRAISQRKRTAKQNLKENAKDDSTIETMGFNKNSMAAIPRLPLQALSPEISLDRENLTMTFETDPCPLARHLDLSSASHEATATDPGVVLLHSSSLRVSSTGQKSGTLKFWYGRSSTSSSVRSQSAFQENFDGCASFSQVEPTPSDYLATVISSLMSTHLRYPSDWTRIRVQDGCTCTILRASKGKVLILVDVRKRKFLVLYDSDRKHMGWKLLASQDATATLDSTALCWASSPISSHVQQTRLVF